MTVYVPRPNHLSLIAVPGESFLSTRETAVQQRLSHGQGAFSWRSLVCCDITEVTSWVWGMQKSHSVSASHGSTSAIPALKQWRRANEGLSAILCYITISRQAWATEDPVWKHHFKPNENATVFMCSDFISGVWEDDSTSPHYSWGCRGEAAAAHPVLYWKIKGEGRQLPCLSSSGIEWE